MTGTVAPRIFFTMVWVELKCPPGVSSWMTKACAPPALGLVMLSPMKSSTAGFMLPSITMRSTWGEDPSLGCANAPAPAAARTRKKITLSVFTVHLTQNFLDVFPYQFFVRRVAQEIGGMKGRHQLDAMIAVPVAAQFGDRNFALQQGLHGELSQRDDDLRSNEIDLFLQERFAGRHLVRLRIAVLGRPALDHIGDINVLALHSHSLGDDVGQKLPGPADERLSLQIFIAPRPFTDEHQLRLGMAHAEDDIGSARAKLAALAIADRRAQLCEILGLKRRRRIRK